MQEARGTRGLANQGDYKLVQPVADSLGTRCAERTSQIILILPTDNIDSDSDRSMAAGASYSGAPIGLRGTRPEA